MKNDLGLSKGLLSSVSSLLKDSSKLKAEEAKADHERLAAHVKPGSMRPLSMEDAKVASYAAKAPERRVSDTITQLYTQSVAEHNAKAQAEAAAIKTAYGKMGGVAPIAEAKELSPKQKKIAAVARDKNAIDAMDFAVLRNRKKTQAGAVSDEKILDGESLDELNKETLGSYVAKATDSAADNAISLGYKAGRRQGGSEHVDKLAKRVAGIKKAAGKMVKEEEVVEYNERSGYSSSKMGGERTTNSTPSVKMGGERTTYTRTPVKDVAKKAFNALTGGSDKDHLDRLKKNMYKEEVEEVGEATSHQAATTMKHIPNPSPALKKAAKDIKPGIAGYRDRADMLKAGGVQEETDTPGNSTHQCAIHVKHATMGEGRTLTSQHAQPDTEGQISWYAVMFEHGIEKVETKDLEILESEWHNQHPYSKSSKKMGIKPKK